VDDTATAIIAGGFVGAMSEIPVYLQHKAGATLTGRCANSVYLNSNSMALPD